MKKPLSQKLFLSENHRSFHENISDKKIWNQFLEGKDSALVYIYNNYVPVLFNYGKQIVNNEALIRDSIQDVFFELINKREKLNEAVSIKLYLLASFRRRLIRILVKGQKMIPEEFNKEYDQSEGFNYSLNTKLIQIPSSYCQDEKKIIENACNQLPKRQREAILLYYFEEFSYKEVADIMNLANSKNARTLIYRALDTLHKKLKKLKNELY